VVLTELRVMIVEDEPVATRRLVRLLRECPAVEVVALVEHGRAALELIHATRPNLLLLDIEMPGIGGFELLERMPASLAPAIVFVTAFDKHACRAFDVRVVDFVLKPVIPDRLSAALANARRDLETRHVERKLSDLQQMVAQLRGRLTTDRSRYDREIWVQQRAENIRVPTDRIDWIEADKDYVRIHSGASCFMRIGLIAGFEQRLDPAEFMRIHRSAIVRLDRVRSVHRGRYGVLDVEIEGGPLLRVGRKYARQVRARISGGAALAH
jgi:two-component system LytT family response regulator/two-component system response regulator AlgR